MTLSLLLRLDGTDGSTTFTDSSPSPKSVTGFGGASISTAQYVFGGSSASFNGSSSYLRAPAHVDFGVGTGDFICEARVYVASLASAMTLFGDILWSAGYQGGWCLRALTTGALSMVYDGGGGWITSDSASGVVSTGAFVHIEVSRTSGVQRVFVDGVKVIEFSNSKDYGAGTRDFNIGMKKVDGNASEFFSGYIDDLVFQKGVSGHTADFTPPTTAFVVDHANVSASVRAPSALAFGGANVAATVKAPTVQSFSGWRANVDASVLAPKARATGRTGFQNSVKASIKAPTAIALSGAVVSALVPKVTAQASATVHERAIVASVIPKVTAQATGTVGIVAAVSAAVPKVTARAQGGATVSASIKAPAVLASATKWISAVVSARMPKVTARALGGGNVLASIKAPAASVSATVGMVARVVASIPAPKASALGCATVSAVIKAPVASSYATKWISAVVNAKAPKITARSLCGGTVAASIKAPVVSASATKWIAAVVNAKIPKITARALGGGNVSASIKAPVVSISATVGIVARVVATIPKTTAKSIGSQAQFARVIASVPVPKAVQRAWVMATMPKVLAKSSASSVIAITREAWAINLQAPADGVAAATHYTGFPFNQIVRLQGNYYGVASDGIYLLGGDTDNGEPIPWAIKTTPTDYGVIQHKRLNSAYIGARMGSKAAVSVHLGEAGQQPYTYRNERGPNAQTHLQRFGKGLCSRYYALGISDASGGEFELDSIDSEAIPLSRAV